jgi:hypothetical protein
MNTQTAKTRSTDRLVALRAMPYAEYLQTPEWRTTRDAALRRAGFRCELTHCGSKYALQVHHRVYERLGEEVPEDLTVLCGACHDQWHHGVIPGRPDDPIGVFVVLAYDTLRDAPESIGDWVAATKAACGRLRLRCEHHQIDQAVTRLLSTLKTTPFVDVPVIPPELLPPVEPSISHSEAVNILAGLGARPVQTMTAVRQLSDEEIRHRQWRADQMKAYVMVQQQILEAAERADALEAAIEDVERRDTPDTPNTPDTPRADKADA